MVTTIVDNLPAYIVRKILSSGMTATELDRALAVPPEAAVLLTGSYSEDVATTVSDIDILILLEGSETFVPDVGDKHVTVFPQLHLTRHLVLLDDLELDIEVSHRDFVQPLMPMIEALRIFEEPEPTAFGLPALQGADARFLTRVGRGRVLAGAERATRWREELKTDLLPAYWFTANFVSAMALTEDAITLRKSDSTFGGVSRSDLAARSAADNLLLASLAALGEVRWDLKALPKVANRFAQDEAGLPAPLVDVEQLAFPGRAGVGAEVDYPDTVFEHAKSLFRYAQHVERLQPCVRFLREFGDGRWDLDSSFLYE